MIDVLRSEYNDALTARFLHKSTGWKQVGKDRFMDNLTGIVFKLIGQSPNPDAIKDQCKKLNKELGIQVNGK